MREILQWERSMRALHRVDVPRVRAERRRRRVPYFGWRSYERRETLEGFIIGSIISLCSLALVLVYLRLALIIVLA